MAILFASGSRINKGKWLLAGWLLLLGASGLSGCATRTAQQKKSAWYKRHRGGKTTPCPCDR